MDTELYNMFIKCEYSPLTQEDAVRITKDMYLILKNAGINVIRIGLKSTDYINENGEITGGTYHPAFRQLVEAEIAKEQLESQLLELFNSKKEQRECHQEQYELSQINQTNKISFFSNGKSFSNMIGNKKSNKIYFEKKYPHVRFTFHVDSDLQDDIYLIF